MLLCRAGGRANRGRGVCRLGRGGAGLRPRDGEAGRSGRCDPVPGAPLVELNRIMGLRATAELEELEPFYESDPVVVSLDPEAGLDEELRAHGYREGYPWQKFERGLDPYEARTELRVAEAGRGDFGPVIAAA